jgi:hypothetical protein
MNPTPETLMPTGLVVQLASKYHSLHDHALSIGGVWELLCMNAWSVTHHSMPKIQLQPAAKF